MKARSLLSGFKSQNKEKIMRIFICVLLAALIPASVPAAPGDIIREIDTGLSHLTGITWDGRYFWVADRSEDRFMAVEPETGNIASSLNSPAYFPSGLAFHDNLLWNTDPGSGKIYATDPETGLHLHTIDSPTPSPTGITWEGDYIWICDNRSDLILKISPGDGTTITSFPAPAGDPRGLVYHRGYLWCSDRITDRIYMIDPENGWVIILLDAPGPFSWGLASRDNYLVNTDYQRDRIFELVCEDERDFITFDTRKATVTFTTEAVAEGSGRVRSLEIFYAVPSDRANQKLLGEISWSPRPSELITDNWDQKVARFTATDLTSGSSFEASMKADFETSAIRYFIYPDRVGSDIPREIRKRYLADEDKYDIGNPYIIELVDGIVGNQENLYIKARSLYQYLIENMEYELSGGWNTAPTVLKRKTGSCSEYTFAYVALCRAAGIPARYVGSLVVRGDEASYDEVFHRWNEIYLPGYGWVPVDANAGDSKYPARQGAAFGGISNRFLITTEGGGNSEYLDWSYNHMNRWVTEGKCSVRFFTAAEWEPIEE
ncbi:MAG: transglutaminase [Candidatus Latescibacteria bacterium]|nr:transglutaminase [bacterium]MBD3424862.1 transglutaminase [Candidatus Latescibacterota bacterium]